MRRQPNAVPRITQCRLVLYVLVLVCAVSIICYSIKFFIPTANTLNSEHNLDELKKQYRQLGERIRLLEGKSLETKSDLKSTVTALRKQHRREVNKELPKSKLEDTTISSSNKKSTPLTVRNEQRDYFRDVLLVVVYYGPFYRSEPLIRQLYGDVFPNMVFYGPIYGEPARYPGEPDRLESAQGANRTRILRQREKHRKPEFIEGEIDFGEGYTGYNALAHAMQRHPDYRGYLFIADDLVMNYFNYLRFDKDKLWSAELWTTCELDKPCLDWWWGTPMGQHATIEALKTLPQKFHDRRWHHGVDMTAAGGYADIAYVPARFREDFIQLANHFAFYDVWLEVGFHTIFEILDFRSNMEYFRGIALWFEDRENPDRRYKPQIDYIHPIKLSDPEARGLVRKWFRLSEEV